VLIFLTEWSPRFPRDGHRMQDRSQ